MDLNRQLGLSLNREDQQQTRDTAYKVFFEASPVYVKQAILLPDIARRCDVRFTPSWRPNVSVSYCILETEKPDL